MDNITLKIENKECFNFALEQCGIPLIEAIYIENKNTFPLENVFIEITLHPDFEESLKIPLPKIHGGDRHKIEEVDLRLPPARMEKTLEAERVILECSLKQDEEDEVLTQVKKDVILSAYNDWNLKDFYAELLACFITPNNPVIMQVLKQVREVKKRNTGDNSLPGYQHNAQTVYEMTKALYETFKDFGISYINPPASFEANQKIRFADMVLHDQMGTCLDLTVLACSCLEQMGLYPLIILVQGHAFIGVWLQEDTINYNLIIEDKLKLINFIESENLLLFNSSTYAASPQPPFEQAIEEARNYLNNVPLTGAVDINICRKKGYKPLPIRMGAINTEVNEEEVTSLAQQILKNAALAQENIKSEEEIKSEEKEPLPKIVEKRFNRWKSSMLDLSMKNKLLNLANLNITKIVANILIKKVEQWLVELLARQQEENNEENIDPQSLMTLLQLVSSLTPEKIIGHNFNLSEQFNLGSYIQVKEAFLQKLLTQILQHQGGEIYGAIVDYLRKQLKKQPFLILDIPSKILPQFEDYLASGKSIEIIPNASDQSESQRANLQNRLDENEILARKTAELVKGRTTAVQGIGLDIPCGEIELYTIGKTLEREALTAQEETGSSTLYLALGLLQWTEPKGNTPILAPLFLYPLQISINRSNRRVKIKLDNADPVGNATLVEKIRQEYGIYLDVVVSPPEDESGFNISKALAEVRTIIANQPGWLVIDACVITTFSFRQFLMWKDLQDNTDILLKNHLVEQVASGGLKPLEDPVGELAPDVLDKVPISEIPAVVSGDSSQLLAVYAALQGRSFVLQGPPGAGKSQTITNLIAAFLAKGKSVLFIAEKMAALEVVQRRLSGIGLGDFCLELHSSDVNRKQVVDSLMTSFNQQRLSKVDASELLADLEQIKQKLADYPIALHEKQSLGLSMYEIMGELEGLESIPTVSLPSSVVEEITPSQLKEMNQALENYAHRVTLVEPITEHLWRFSNCADWSLSLELEVTNLLNQLRNNTSELEDKLSLWLDNISNHNSHSILQNQWKPSWNIIRQIPLLGEIINSNLPECVYDQNNWTKSSEIAKEWLNASRDSFERKQQVSQRWQDSIYGLDLVAKIKTFEKLERMFPLFRWIMQIIPRFSLRSIVKGKLPSNQQILTDLRSSIEVKNLSSRIEPLNKEIERLFSPYWQSDYNSFDELKLLIEKGDILHELICQLEPQLLELISNLKNQTNSVKDQLIALIDELNESITIFDNNWQKFNDLVKVKADIISLQEEDFITQIKRLLNQLSTAQRDFQNWCRYQKTIKELEDNQLESFIKAHQKGEIEIDKLAKVLRKSILYPWFVKYFDSQSILRNFDGNEQREYIHKFNNLYKEYLKLNQQVIKSELCQNLPSGAVVFEGSEVGVLKRENEKQKAHIPIRALLQKIPNLLPKLKPCLLMSPASVAHFLPADGNPFDLVVFDEASQVETHNAIGALARGKQVVIVGDSKQMPPTSFFGGGGGGDAITDENDIVDMESFLTEAIASQFPEQMLEWHYRSRHEMLIQFSNHNYYKGKLNIFPAAETKSNELGVKWHHIKDGYYLKGEEKNNPVEARALVDYLVQRLKNYEAKKRTFGVITFSMPQKFLIDELLDEARRLYPEIEPHFDKEFDERVFVKNLENVQGDERDEILFSICYAPDKNGNFSVNFGPLNRQGGERRLNVAVTRARDCMHIFSTITGSQIDMNRTDAIGALHLKEFLEFAEKSSQESDRSFLRTNDFDSDIERQIYEELVKMSYTVNCKVGSGSYRVDLAVVHPNNSSIYVLGIETDGISYNQAPTVLDREGVRQVVLGLMRWNMYRIWSVDWKFKREEEVAKLKQAVEKAIKEFDNKTTFSSENNNETAKDNESSPIKDEIPNELKVSELKPNELEENQSNVLIVQENSPSGFKLRVNEQIEDNISQTINDLANNISFQNNQVSQNSEIPKTDENTEISHDSVQANSTPFIPYEKANLDLVTEDKQLIYNDESTPLIKEKIIQLVEIEAPILLSDVLRPVAQCWAYSSISKKLNQHLTTILNELIKEERIYLDDDFLWNNQSQCQKWDKARKNDGENKRKIEQISLQELAVIAEWIIRQSLSIDEEGLMREMANHLDFKQLTQGIRTRLEQTIKYVEARGNIKLEGGRIIWK